MAKILNIGCGTKTSASPDIIHLDWSMYLHIRSNPLLSALSLLFLDKGRLKALKTLPDTVIAHDVKKGIPFPDNSIDAVYHCHFFGHLDREDALKFIAEAKRVLKEGGIHRIAIPDFELICTNYLQHVKACEENPDEQANHDRYISKMIEIMVRKEPYGTSCQKPLRRWLENLFLGDARKRGETLQWYYDRMNLTYFLQDAGYRSVSRQTYQTSGIPGWNDYGLDLDASGDQYRPGTLYIEAVK
jgi:SAM-dependent methyltransferase